MDSKPESQRVHDVAKMLDHLKTIKQPFEPVVDRINEFVLLGKKVNSTIKGNLLSENVYDSYPVWAMDSFANNTYAYDCASSLPWFMPVLPNKVEFPRYSALRKFNGKRLDDIPEIAEFLSYTQDVLISDFNRSTFYEEIISFIREGGGPGTAVCYIREDEKSGRMCFRPLHFREFFIAENRFRKIDTLFFRTSYTLKMMVEEFGREICQKIDQGFEQAYKSDPFQERTIINAVYPRTLFDPEKKDNENKPFISQWFQEGKNDYFLRDSGYDYFPYMTWRYSRMVDELYGRGWAWKAWADVATLNVQSKKNLSAAAKLVDPVLISTDMLRGKDEQRHAGAIIRMERITEDQMPRYLNEGIQLPFSVEMQDRMRQSVDKWSHAEMFQILSQAVMNKVEMTALQALHISGEKAAALAYMTDGLNHGPLQDAIDIMYNAAEEAGRLPPIPEVLLIALESGRVRMEIDFNSPLAQMQKTLFKTQPIRAGLALAAEMAGLGTPEAVKALQNIDFNDLMRSGLKAVSFPSTSIRPEEETAQRLAQKNKMEQDQMALANTVTAAKALPAAGKGVDPNSPLAALTGMGGQQQ